MPGSTMELIEVEEVATPRAKERPTKSSTTATRATAETMAGKQRDISVSEFFAKNRHLLGFDNPRKALLTAVKEAVDNSLDACEEAGILPEITVVIEDMAPGRAALRSDPSPEQSTPKRRGKGERKGNPIAPNADAPRDAGSESRANKSSRYRVTVVDNGPGIVRKQVENIFGRLLYGSKFHRLKMSRGQQGIGISAAGMYGLITTGRPMMIQTRPSAKKPAHHIELAMNTKTNRAEVTVDEETEDFPLSRLRSLTAGTRELDARGEFLSPDSYPTGTSVTIELEGKYQRGRGSVDEFLDLTAIANPHARIVFVPPGKTTPEETDTAESELGFENKSSRRTPDARGESSGSTEPSGSPSVNSVSSAVNSPQTAETSGVIVFPRAVNELPPETREIQPHPRGVELGILLQMMKEAQGERDTYTLYNFLQDKFCRVSASSASAFCEAVGVTARTRLSDIDHAQGEKLYKHLLDARLPPPPTDCLAPIGVRQLLAGLLKGVRAEFYAASSREPDIYRGRPFLIEAAIAFGGELPADEPARVIRFANRVPLQYQQSACSAFKGVIETNWRNYDLQQPRGAAPVGPLVIMLHMASVWVPFTSESKEAIADYDEVRKEMKLALMECGRKLGTYLRKRQKMRRESERRDIFERYIGEVAKATSAVTGEDTKKLYDALLVQAKKRTAMADLELDDEGKAVKGEDPADQEGVIIIEPPSTPGTHGTVSGAGAAGSVPAGDSGQPTRSRKSRPEPSKSSRQPAPSPVAASSPKSSPALRPDQTLFGEAPAAPAKKKVLVRRKVTK